MYSFCSKIVSHERYLVITNKYKTIQTNSTKSIGISRFTDVHCSCARLAVDRLMVPLTFSNNDKPFENLNLIDIAKIRHKID